MHGAGRDSAVAGCVTRGDAGAVVTERRRSLRTPFSKPDLRRPFAGRVRGGRDPQLNGQGEDLAALPGALSSPEDA
jgi:hypothetical protein